MAKIILSLLLIPCVPYIKAKEKASIDKLNAIRKMVTIFTIYHLSNSMPIDIQHRLFHLNQLNKD